VFTVIWTPSANGEFAAILFSYPDRLIEIDDAGQDIDDKLRSDPTSYGHHLSENLWRITSGPLAAFYSIEGNEVVLDTVHWIG
jgi:hypothetical protein